MAKYARWYGKRRTGTRRTSTLLARSATTSPVSGQWVTRSTALATAARKASPIRNAVPHTTERRPRPRPTPLARIEPGHSPGEFVRQSPSNGRPVLTDVLSGQRPSRSSAEFVSPGSSHRGGVLIVEWLQTGQEPRRDIGSVLAREGKRLLEDCFGVGGHHLRVQRGPWVAMADRAPVGRTTPAMGDLSAAPTNARRRWRGRTERRLSEALGEPLGGSRSLVGGFRASAGGPRPTAAFSTLSCHGGCGQPGGRSRPPPARRLRHHGASSGRLRTRRPTCTAAHGRLADLPL